MKSAIPFRVRELAPFRREADRRRRLITVNSKWYNEYMDNTVGSLPISRRTDPVTTGSRNAGRNRSVSTDYYTPSSTLKLRNIPDYISGYVDGEGCFTVTFNAKAKALLGWELRPSFSVSQNEDRRQVLDIIREYFGCGYIRRDYADKTVKFEVRDHDELMTKVIPHFERFPLLSKKQKDFELFRSICKLIDETQHLNRDGFVNILQLAYRMNGSGKRKRTKEEIIKRLQRR